MSGDDAHQTHRHQSSFALAETCKGERIVINVLLSANKQQKTASRCRGDCIIAAATIRLALYGLFRSFACFVPKYISDSGLEVFG
jgi:hypothetical protein